MITAKRFHDFSAGHRVVGHENACRGFHGHNYRVHFECAASPGIQTLDAIGRVIDFGVIKSKLCQWLEDNWDHKMLLWERDPIKRIFMLAVGGEQEDRMDGQVMDELEWLHNNSLCLVPFNPTAENMAEHLRTVIGPQQLAGTEVYLRRVQVDETRKCSAVSEE